MLFIINLFVIGIAGLLVLLLAASASLPASVAATDPDAPEGEWVGPARLPRRKPVKVRAPILKVRMAKLQAADLPSSR